MKFPLVLFSCVVLLSCGDDSIKEDGASGDMMAATLQDTCSCDQLSADNEGLFLRDKIPFTGVCYSNYPETDVRYLEKSMLQGQLHGKVTYFSQEGEILIEEIYEYGTQKRSSSSGDVECDCSELEIAGTIENVSRYTLDDIPFSGRCTKHYPDSGKVYMEASYKEGFLSGSTTYYDRNGKTLYIEVYDTGILVNTIYGSEN